MVSARQREEEAKDLLFDEVLNQLALAKAFKDRIFQLHRYKNPASYFKGIHRYTAAEAKAKATPINMANNIFVNFDKILANLRHCHFIDIRKLSVNKLNEALDPNWCITYNEGQRERSHASTGQQQQQHAYDEADFWDLLRKIKGHPAYAAIDRSRNNNFGKSEIAALMNRMTKRLLDGN